MVEAALSPLWVADGLDCPVVVVYDPESSKRDRASDYARGLGSNLRSVRVKPVRVVQLLESDWREWVNSGMLLDSMPWLEGVGGTWWPDTLGLPEESADWTDAHRELFLAHCVHYVVEVRGGPGRVLYVDPSGFPYARYVFFTDGQIRQLRKGEEL